MSIPPKKHGAIEVILWNYKLELEKLGHTVVIFNDQNLPSVASQVNRGGFDFVHLHYSEYISFFLRHLQVPFCTTCHSGYITNVKKWSLGYYSVFYDMMKCAGIISLSPMIQQMYFDHGYTGFARVIRNGIDTKNFVLTVQGNNKALCLGRIEPRKRQAWLASIVSDKVDLDFVGPIVDPDFKADNRCRYVGYWSKPEVYQNLSHYSCLVLLSAGEAAPLVVPEALAAGLSVVVSRSAAANLDESLPFISVLPDDMTDPEVISETINAQIRNNAQYRPQIIEYAKSYFDTSAVVADYVKVIGEFRNTDHTVKNTVTVRLRELPRYLLSRSTHFIKGILRGIRQILKTTAPK